MGARCRNCSHIPQFLRYFIAVLQCHGRAMLTVVKLWNADVLPNRPLGGDPYSIGLLPQLPRCQPPQRTGSNRPIKDSSTPRDRVDWETGAMPVRAREIGLHS